MLGPELGPANGSVSDAPVAGNVPTVDSVDEGGFLAGQRRYALQRRRTYRRAQDLPLL